jgi:Chemotaxis signal transduction protein
MQSTKQAIFMLGEEEYGLDIMDVNTIEKVITVEPITKLSDQVKGVINIRGDIIPLYSLRRKFGLEDIDYDADTRFIITNSNGIKMAYEVDKVTEITMIEESQISEVPAILKAEDTSYVKAVANIGGRLVIVLNNDGILSEEEQNKIKAVMKK